MTTLFDGNVLIALLVDDHVHHQSAEQWWATRTEESFATTPITQGTLLRFLIREGLDAHDAIATMRQLTSTVHHEFWSDDFEYDESIMRGVIGHRQITDAYLAELARRRRGRLATFDAGLKASHTDVVELVPMTGRS